MNTGPQLQTGTISQELLTTGCWQKKGTFHIKILDLEGTVPQNRAAGAQFRLQADSSIKKRSKLSS